MTQYLKAVDPDGNTTTLICRETHDKIVLLQPVQAVHRTGYEVNILEVNSEDELRARIGGQIVAADDEDYNNTLFNTWGFDGSNVYSAVGQPVENTSQKGEEKNDGNENENPGSDVKTSVGSQEGDGQSEQQAQPDPATDNQGQEGLGQLQGGSAQPEKPGDEPQSGDDLGIGDAKDGEHDANDGDRGAGDVAPDAEPAHDTGSDPVNPVSAGEADDGNGSSGTPGDKAEKSA